MAKIYMLSAFLLQLLYTSVQGQNSPCPDRFTYIKKPGSDETIGEIEIQNPSINNLELRLKVDLKIDTQLPTLFVGGVDLTKSEEDAARDVLEGRPLLYHVYFPVQNPLPTVHKILFNNHQICSGPEVSGIVVTVITLEHNFKIIIRPAQNQTNPPPQNIPTEHKPNSGGNPFVSPFTPEISKQTSIDRIENYNDCGISSRGSESPNLLTEVGKKTLPGQWPWVVAIFRETYLFNHDTIYQCVGTLLTKKHVLTAGRCLMVSKDNNNTIPAYLLSVALGRYKLGNTKLLDSNESEIGVNMEVARYIFHPEFTNTFTADSDLAILILRFSVKFTAFIRSICLLPPSVDFNRLEQLEQTDGIIVGWGRDGGGGIIKESPKLEIMPIVRLSNCVRSTSKVATIVSERTFCAGGQNITISAGCIDVSGSGLVVFDSVTGRYQLRGIMSRTVGGPPFGEQPFCKSSQYVVFVDVFKYLTWINQQISST